MPELTDEEFHAAHPELPRDLDPGIRSRLKDTDRLVAELETERTNRVSLERRAAFAESGLADLPHRELFERTYDGDLTAEAIRDAADKYGLVPDASSAAATQQSQSQADLEAFRRVGQASQGAGTPGAVRFEDALDNAGSYEEVLSVLASGGAGAGIGLKGRVV